MARALRDGSLKRNFQGYTEDPADALIGLGASSISRFPQGYAQNAPATSAYTAAIREGQFSTAKGHGFGGDDLMRSRMIEMLMCFFCIDADELVERFGADRADLMAEFARTNAMFDGLLRVTDRGLEVPEPARPLARMIARALDAYDLSTAGHSSAI
jgi:oxygen-independent coproporphyrinogen-3 oxidase